MSLVNFHRHQELSEGPYPYLKEGDETGLLFQIYCLKGGQEISFFSSDHESALVVLQGQGKITYNVQVSFDRPHWKTHNPWAVHFPAGDRVTITCHSPSGSGVRLALLQTANVITFPGKIYSPSQVSTENRGEGILDNTCFRLVRLIFDATIAPAEAKLVLGEVINFPGKWSSYPPHHHHQPEIYYYEFDHTREGYGHGECGDDVFKIYHQDLLKITGNKDHSQVAAPGFTMFYLWGIRHLDNQRYTGFEYTTPYEKLLHGKG